MQPEWSADEVFLVGFYAPDFVEGNFDSLWSAAEAREMTDAQRMADLERQAVDVQMALCEMYEALMGVE